MFLALGTRYDLFAGDDFLHANSTMNRRRKSDRALPTLSVTTNDGTTFRCSLSAIGRETDPRWVLLDQNGLQYVGPTAEQDKSPEAVQRLVNDWWEGRKTAR